MRRRFPILNKAQTTSGGGAFIVRSGDAQIARGVVKVSVLHESCARPFTPFGVASDHGREQFGADHATGFAIVRTENTFVVRLARENFVRFFGGATHALFAAVLAGWDDRRDVGETRSL